MRRGEPGNQDDADANRALHILDCPPSLNGPVPIGSVGWILPFEICAAYDTHGFNAVV